MINLYFLKYFSDAARTRSVGQSAKINHVTRSAISQSIRKLEDQLGIPLLSHKKNHFELTSAGQLLAEKCGDLFHEFERLTESLSAAKGGGSGPLRFAASHSMALSLLPDPLADLTRKYPGLKPLLRTADATKGRGFLRSREVDLLLAVDDGGFEEFETVPVRRGQFVCVQSGKAQKTSEALRFIVGDKGSEIQKLKKSYLKRYRKPLPVFMEVESWESIITLAAKGIGIGYIPDFIYRSRPWPGVGISELGLELPPYTLVAAARSLDSLPRNAKLLLDELARAAD